MEVEDNQGVELPNINALAERIEGALNQDVETRLKNHLRWARWWQNVHGWCDIIAHIIVLCSGLLAFGGVFSYEAQTSGADGSTTAIGGSPRPTGPMIVPNSSSVDFVDFSISSLPDLPTSYSVFQIVTFASGCFSVAFQVVSMGGKYALLQSKKNQESIDKIKAESAGV
jgi:hypothetical protein